jgi:hypothetical protein
MLPSTISGVMRTAKIQMKRAGLLVFLLLAGCAGSESREPAGAMPGAAPTREASLKPAAQTVPAAVRRVIRTATIGLVVENAAASLTQVVAVVEGRGGYVAETKQWLEDGQARASATLRVPADQLTSALDEIRKKAIRVSNEGITGQDVSEEYADLGAQLTNLHAAEAELRQLLTTVRERTQKASEVLEVYRELSKIRGDIDRLQGRVDYLKQMTAMSTINVELIPDQLSQPLLESTWRPLAIATAAGRTLVSALKGLGTVLIWLAVFVVPMMAVLIVLALSGKKLWEPVARWRGRQPQPSPPPST